MKMRKSLAFLGLGLLIALSGCGTKEENTDQAQNMQGTEETGTTIEPEEENTPSGSFPYFREDTDGSLLRYADGWFYGYLGGKLIRIEEGTMEVSVLYEAKSTQSGNFCFYGDDIYFMDIPETSFRGGIRGRLCRIGRDGSNFTVLMENVRLGEYPEYGADPRNKERIAVYEDILYVMWEENAACFRLLADGNVEEVALSETLYKFLPSGYTAPYEYSTLPSIPYCAARYGFFFAQNEDGLLMQIDAADGSRKVLSETDAGYRSELFLTGEALYQNHRNGWLRYALDKVEEPEPVFSNWEWGWQTYMVFWKEDGFYLVDPGDYYADETQLYFVDWEGNGRQVITLDKNEKYTRSGGDVTDRYYLYDGWLYYGDYIDDRYMLIRQDIDGGEPQMIFCYEEDVSLRYVEEEYQEWTAESTGEERLATEFTGIHFKDEVEDAGQLNSYLAEINREVLENLEKENQWFIEEWLHDEEWPMTEEEYDDTLTGSMQTAEVYLNYIDENYVEIAVMYYAYYWFAAHGSYWTEFYVLDRSTGERLNWRDFTENTEEEMNALLGEYIMALQGWRTDPAGEAEASLALAEGRLFLTSEGLGFHYDVYEVTSYAEGALDVIIPFEDLKMKEGMTPEY